MSKERIDKILAGSTALSRKEVKAILRQKRVAVNGVPIADSGFKVDIAQDEITVDGALFTAKKHIYLMLNKPAGIVSASRAEGEKTVVDLVPPQFQRSGLFPAGRLDKDTTGFVLITDDGEFAHRILSPKNHIRKTYTACLENPITAEDIAVLQSGLTLRDGTRFLPASVKVLDSTNRLVQIQICEGKYHQIKRMFLSVGNRVLALSRTHMGALELDAELPSGGCRELREEELQKICETDFSENTGTN